MAFDGLFIRALSIELNTVLNGAKINKIAQPNKDELIISGRGNNGNFRLFMSASPSLPLIYLTDDNKPSPATAPAFCMLLRKHISAGRIIDVTQVGYERVIKIRITHLNELGDVCYKSLYVELMGKYSNIIFTDDEDNIIDSIKRVSSLVSSVREVLPGRKYFIPVQEGRLSPDELTENYFYNTIMKKPLSTHKAIYTSLVGISPVMAQEACYLAGSDGDAVTASVADDKKALIYKHLQEIISKSCQSNEPVLYITDEGDYKEFSYMPLSIFNSLEEVKCDTLSALLVSFYSGKNAANNIKNKSADLRKTLSNLIERTVKKLDLQEKQLKDTENRDKFRVYGELLNTYGYSAAEGDKSITVINYYDNQELTIPLDPTLKASENALKYFEKYNKLKRTFEAVTNQLEESRRELDILKSIEADLLIAQTDADLSDVRSELADNGFIKKTSGKKQHKMAKNKPYHFIDNNGFHIYVGKNNYQNDELTFKFATGNDWWFHTKSVHGSHVIVKCEGRELPDETFETAASLAAYYSAAREAQKVEIDYVQKKQVKKPAGAAAGFVVYYTNYSMMANPSLDKVTPVD